MEHFSAVLHITKYKDEIIYINAGLMYIQGTLPISYNYEHPPLAKYIIGLAAMYNYLRIILYIFCFLTLIAYYMVVYVLCKNKFLAYLSTSILTFDTLYINTYRFALLDPIVACFTLWAMYFGYRYLEFQDIKFAIISHVIWGLALASKLSAVYIFISWIIICLYISLSKDGILRGITKFLALSLITALVYVLTYIQELIYGGLGVLIQHHVKMMEYMMWRHSPSLPLIANGFLTLMFKISVWNYYTPITIYVENNTIVSICGIETAKLIGRYIVFKPGMGSPIWHLFIFLLLLKSIKLFRKPKTYSEILLLSSSWSSLLLLIHGDIDWYYLLPILFLYMISTYKTRMKFIVLLLIASMLYYILFILGIIPFKTSIIIKQ